MTRPTTDEEGHLDSLLAQTRRRVFPQLRRQAGEHAPRRFQKHDVHLFHIQRPVVPPEWAPDQLGEGTRELHARGPATDDHKGQQPPAPLDIGLLCSPLKARQDLVAQGYALFERSEREGMRSRPRDSEEVGRAAGGQDLEIVGEHLAVGLHHLGGEVHPLHIRHDELDVAPLSEDAPHRIGDVLGLQLRGGHLVEQREEGVVVVAVQQQNVDR